MSTFRVTFMDDNRMWSEVHDIDNIVLFSQSAASKVIHQCA